MFSRKFQLLLLYRLGSEFYSNPVLAHLNPLLAWLMGTLYASEISFQAKLGRNIRFNHPIGIVIGQNVTIHDDVTIFQHVTLGSHGRPGAEPSYPVIRQGTVIYANASIIGGVTVGESAIIGAHSLVTKDVPAHRIAAGVPAKILGDVRPNLPVEISLQTTEIS